MASMLLETHTQASSRPMLPLVLVDISERSSLSADECPQMISAVGAWHDRNDVQDQRPNASSSVVERVAGIRYKNPCC